MARSDSKIPADVSGIPDPDPGLRWPDGVDAHCHGVRRRRCVLAGVTNDDPWRRGPGVAQTLGLHPWHLPDDLDAALQELADRAAALRPDGVGETGLDRARRGRPPQLPGADDAESGRRGRTRATHQERALEAQAELARVLKLPIVLHVVRAHGAVRSRVAGLRGLVHDVACDPQEVKRWVDAGYLLSVSQRGLRRPECVRAIPDDALLLESDDGDDDAWARALLGVAALRGQDPDGRAATTAANALRLFPWLAGETAPRGHAPKP